MKPGRKRKLVDEVCGEWQVSIRKACAAPLDEPDSAVDDASRRDLVLCGFGKAEQDIAAIHLAAVEKGCPAGDARIITRAIKNVVIQLLDESVIAEAAIFALEFH